MARVGICTCSRCCFSGFFSSTGNDFSRLTVGSARGTSPKRTKGRHGRGERARGVREEGEKERGQVGGRGAPGARRWPLLGSCPGAGGVSAVWAQLDVKAPGPRAVPSVFLPASFSPCSPLGAAAAVGAERPARPALSFAQSPSGPRVSSQALPSSAMTCPPPNSLQITVAPAALEARSALPHPLSSVPRPPHPASAPSWPGELPSRGRLQSENPVE